MIDGSFICQWAKVQNQHGNKYFFPSLYLSDFVLLCIHARTLRSQDAGLLIVPRILKQTAEGRAFSYFYVMVTDVIFLSSFAPPCACAVVKVFEGYSLPCFRLVN